MSPGRAMARFVGWAAVAAFMTSSAQAQDLAAATGTGDAWITLGTQGGPQPSATRGQPANLFQRGKTSILVDAGDGVSTRLAAAGIPLAAVEHIFLSHLHLDHVGGLMGVIGLRYATSLPGVVTIYGPPGTRELVDGILAGMRPISEAGYGPSSVSMPSPTEGVRVVEMRDGDVARIGDVSIRAAANSHYGFTADDPRADQWLSLSYRFESPERVVVYTGDTGRSDAVAALARGSDLLVSEVIEPDPMLERIRKQRPDIAPPALAELARHLVSHHLTPGQVGALAQAAGVKRVVLTHLVPGAADEAAQQSLEQAVRRTYSGPVQVAEDLDRF